MELGLRLAGTVKLAGLAAPPNWQPAHVLLTQARRMYPGLGGTYAESRLSTWMGHRPSLPDSLPVIGASRKCKECCLCLWARPYRHGRSGQDRQDGCRVRFRRTAPDSMSLPSVPAASVDPRRRLGPLPSAPARRDARARPTGHLANAACRQPRLGSRLAAGRGQALVASARSTC